MFIDYYFIDTKSTSAYPSLLLDIGRSNCTVNTYLIFSVTISQIKQISTIFFDPYYPNPFLYIVFTITASNYFSIKY